MFNILKIEHSRKKLSNVIAFLVFGVSYLSMLIDPNLELKVIYVAIILILIDIYQKKILSRIFSFQNLRNYWPVIAFLLYSLSCLKLPFIPYRPLNIYGEFFLSTVAIILLSLYIREIDFKIFSKVLITFFIIAMILTINKINISDGVYFDPLEINRLSTLLGILFFPTIYIAYYHFSKINLFIKYFFIITLLAVTFVYMKFGYGDTMKLIIVLGIMSYVFAVIFKKISFIIYMILFTMIVIIQPWWGDILANIIPQSLLDIMKDSARERLLIWSAYGEIVRVSPIWGIGFAETSFVKELPIFLEISKGAQEKLIAPHPHNNFLQIWVELGLPGIVIFWIFVMRAARYLSKLPEKILPLGFSFLCSTTAAALVFDAAWRQWWITSIGIGVLIILVIERNEREMSIDNISSN